MMINREKLDVMFSPNTSDALQIQKETMNERHLPLFVGKLQASIFAYLKDRVWKRIQGRKEKLPSRAGKEILIKAVAQAIPT